jgi:hypothetical protein
MSYFVNRARGTMAEGNLREGWVGPIRSRTQADREADAWRADGWRAYVVEATPGLRKKVNAWQREADIRLGRKPRR